MYIEKRGFILYFLLVLVFGLVCVNTLSGDEVDDIYAMIKNAPPKYQWEEKIVTYQNMGMTIVCTLTTPKDRKSFPIILLAHGFGGERHGWLVAGTDEGYYDRFARIFAENGLCTLRIDFRGSGETGGGFELNTFSNQKSDAIAALDFIETLDDPVNSKKIGMLGHSQGGLVTAITSAADNRIKSACILAGVANPSHDYVAILLREGVKKGLSLPPGTVDIYGLWLEGVFVTEVPLVHEFFEELFSIAPLVEISRFERPLMYISTLQDVVVWPQPQVGMSYMKHHEGEEKLVLVDAGPNLSYMLGPEKVDEAACWIAAWFIHTLKKGRR
jgi:pimeloyl-ACP methyl ester carboxylesterase